MKNLDRLRYLNNILHKTNYIITIFCSRNSTILYSRKSNIIYTIFYIAYYNI